ncbi:C45 family peptidase [Allokutzneria albata]|uniref:Acyl-coenzyme A:6-aminopenicillanic acid acyl-transferase n=1 Tax=Allokutzneria albata TaxID=211114 RepID=A0A1H0DIJ6_ALLAB|nr:C45 family peptidase [Allokutzneria albata]SDN69831.1 Acyl-coenzyme A:6-aminopenicillanic acid acyl-transferase [Allokutzneria albata]
MAVQKDIIAGTNADFMIVRELTVSGEQEEIGRALAEEAARSYGWRPVPADRRTARARRLWFERNWPQHHERMRGAALALGLDFEADEYYVDGLSGVPNGSACSATFLPPGATEEGRGLLGRNYDFFTTSAADLFAMLSGGQPTGGSEPPMASRPFVVRSKPTDGPATTLITMDTLDGCMDGINEHGLAVVLLIADAETAGEPVAAGPQVGLSSIQLPRFVLDTCATAEEARAALLGAKQYDLGTPLHYLIADASGDCFVWERDAGGDEHITDGDGGALCVTNHLLHKHSGELPADNAETMLTYERHRRLSKETEARLSGAGVRAAVDAVNFDAVGADVPYPIRTLWRSVFDLGERTLSARFYLADDRYSDELTFTC